MLQPLWIWWSTETLMTLAFAAGAFAAFKRAGEIDPVEAEDHVGLAQRREPFGIRVSTDGAPRCSG